MVIAPLPTHARVLPSAGDLATCATASVPAAPARFSTTTVRPRTLPSCWPKARAVKSAVPPALAPTTIRITLASSWARAVGTASGRLASPARTARRLRRVDCVIDAPQTREW